MQYRDRIVKFGSDNVANDLSGMSSEEIDALAFGAIEVDRDGNVQQYNAAEGEISGRSPQEMIGRNFFTEVAPCTSTDAFRGKFEDGVESGHLNTTLVYTFDYEMAPTQVRVKMQESEGDGRYWILVKRI